MTPAVTPRSRDALAAGITWIVALAGLVALPLVSAADSEGTGDVPGPDEARWWLLLAGLTLQALVLLGARTRPAIVPLAVAAVGLAVSLVAGEAAPGLTSLAVVVAVYRAVSVSQAESVRWALVGTAGLVAAAIIAPGLGGSAGSMSVIVAGVLQAAVVVAAPAAVAVFVASRRAAAQAHRSEAEAIVREQEARWEAAIARERTGMARELHDIAAHHLSGIAVMLAAVDRQIETDPQAARAAVREVRGQSRAVLDDLRRLVGLLRDDGAAHTSVESIETLPALVEQAAAAPGGVELVVLHGPTGLPTAAGVGPLAQLAAYRMVQESLANARSHAPGAPCRVEVDDRAPDQVVVTVDNAASSEVPAASSGGFGLRGMQERADLVGARLEHGPTVDGGWRVRLTLPREPGAATTEGEHA
ncbi:sensor histidine kinase [Aeromicrobium duanguangcaii]|uniref:histidine kinase n=1 Tax=Aeromicrobium duanguangcaii TaxID=2968086 RepID=A0ABY5KEC4_9ACTN|nr:histidine kinase [Aeromicrobium duanguangcaii]MCD9154804.1 histidine kinase [Aeromicrobium duanguangcaii]UUI67781.1 histidine kinase [Aeromicrobium duanguangcaii]